MSSRPKLRIFAGPNGSGKTTLFDSIKPIYFSTRLFINADFLEEQFKKNKFINLTEYNLSVTAQAFTLFCEASGLYAKALFDTATWNLDIKENVIVQKDPQLNTAYNSYHFAIIADFIRNQLITDRQSFSFETVFSHPAKLKLIEFAHQHQYKVYLYFIGTETPIMNLERVKDRIKKGGHFVDEEKIEKRYFLTMDLLPDMIKKVDEVYLWDNSGLKHQFVGSIKDGFVQFEQLTIPAWVDHYILQKLKTS